jgi:hypothetical protein
MDQAPNHSSPDSGATRSPPAATGVSPAQSTWDDYYKEAARRRRAASTGHDLRVEKRRRRLLERLGIVVSALLVGAMTLAFYLVLR